MMLSKLQGDDLSLNKNKTYRQNTLSAASFSNTDLLINRQHLNNLYIDFQEWFQGILNMDVNTIVIPARRTTYKTDNK